MLICHKAKVIFVCIPHTASTQIAEILKKNGFMEVRDKHSLPYFIPRRFRDYQLIGGFVDPLVDLKSMYWKFRNDHLGLYSEALNSSDGRHRSLGWRGRKFFKMVRDGGATFNEFAVAAAQPYYVSQICAAYRQYDLRYNRKNLESDWEVIRNLCKLDKSVNLTYGNVTEKGDDEQVSGDILKMVRPQRELLSGELSICSSRNLGYLLFARIKCSVWWFRELRKCLGSPNYRNMMPS